jgi:hypothetical protein
MAHFAKVENNIVTEVLVAEQDFINSGKVGNPSEWVQTSYNTHGGVHYSADDGEGTRVADGGVALRKNFGCVGDIYDATRDAFYKQKPYPSWVLNEDTCYWESPVPMPAIPDDTGFWKWNEPTTSWIWILF